MATITVTTNDGGKKATCVVTVKAKVIPVESVSLDKTSLTAGIARYCDSWCCGGQVGDLVIKQHVGGKGFDIWRNIRNCGRNSNGYGFDVKWCNDGNLWCDCKRETVGDQHIG